MAVGAGVTEAMEGVVVLVETSVCTRRGEDEVGSGMISKTRSSICINVMRVEPVRLLSIVVFWGADGK